VKQQTTTVERPSLFSFFLVQQRNYYLRQKSYHTVFFLFFVTPGYAGYQKKDLLLGFLQSRCSGIARIDWV